MNGQYPRALREVERNLLATVLPQDRPGYRAYRERIERMAVIGEGRRGTGNLVLGPPEEPPDLSGPLAQVVAYGAVETTDGVVTVTVREVMAGQIDVEIVSNRGESVPDRLNERRRWSYSDWLPGLPSPATGTPVREVGVGRGVTLALSSCERRLWVHDATSGIVHLLPVTGFYNELMLHMHIRDPKIALAPGHLFDELGRYTDQDLRAAFLAENRIRQRVEVKAEKTTHRQTSISSYLKKRFSKDL